MSAEVRREVGELLAQHWPPDEARYWPTACCKVDGLLWLYVPRLGWVEPEEAQR